MLLNGDNYHHYNKGVYQSHGPTPVRLLNDMESRSNQVLQKNDDGTIGGVRYIIATEPSTLRPIKSWTIRIEKWLCETHADITADDILFIRVLNTVDNVDFKYQDYVRHLDVRDKSQAITDQNAFNAMMAAMVFISKIDAGRLPNSDKILSLHHF